MRATRRSRAQKKDKWGNRMAMLGITMVVLSLAVVVNIKGSSLKSIDHDYQIRLDSLNAIKKEEEKRAEELEEECKYVQTKEYIKEVAKEKLGLVDPDEILLKPGNVE